MSVDALFGSLREVGEAWTRVAADLLGTPLPTAPPLAPTARDELPLEGGAKLYRFRSGRRAGTPLLLIPSLINRWYVLDLRSGASLVEALVGADFAEHSEATGGGDRTGSAGAAGAGAPRGFDVWLLDWGVPQAEDRYLDWEAVLARLGRAVRRVRRETGAAQVGMLGYCMGGTLTTIYAAQHADEIAALVTLAAPIEFAKGGQLRRMVDPRWFDPEAIADAGNVAPAQMQAGFVALRPTLDLAKLVSMPDLATDPRGRDAFLALDAWASDNIPFPAAAYRRYIGDLYQRDELVAGTHRVGGKSVDLGQIRCPVLVITASRDQICPPLAATALLDHIGSTDTEVLEVAGGHVGAVVGSRAAREMYPALACWLAPRLA